MTLPCDKDEFWGNAATLPALITLLVSAEASSGGVGAGREMKYTKKMATVTHVITTGAHTGSTPRLALLRLTWKKNGVSDVTITNLTSGKKVVGFNRGMGILKFDASQDASGKVKVVAQLGFETQTIEDALAFLQATPEVKKDDEKVLQTAN